MKRTSGFIEPCLPSLADRPPSGSGWIHEIKHDGFRLLARRDAAGVRLLIRNGNDFTARYPLIVEAVAAARANPRRACAPCDGHQGQDRSPRCVGLYTGAELVRLLLGHPRVEIALLTADRKANREMREVFLQFSPFALQADATRRRKGRVT